MKGAGGGGRGGGRVKGGGGDTGCGGVKGGDWDSGGRGGGGGGENFGGGGFTFCCESTMVAKKKAMTRVNTGESIQITQTINCFFCFFIPSSHLGSLSNSSSELNQKIKN